MIDHGASLYLQHTWTDVETRARTSFPQIADHVLLPIAGSIVEAGARLRTTLASASVGEIVDAIPSDWLLDCAPFATPAKLRQAYLDLISVRVSVADLFEREAEQARLARVAV